MRLIDHVSEYIEVTGNGKWCEDKTLIGANMIGVMDGATPIDQIRVDNHPTQACWFVDGFADGFYRQACEPGQSIDSFCEMLIGQMDRTRMNGIEKFNHPCCTAAFLRLEDSSLLISVLGDCHVYVLSKKDKTIRFIYDDRVDVFSEKTRVESNQGFKNALDRDKAVRTQKILNREYLNKPGGFYALTLDGSWKGEFVEARVPLAEADSILMCSDGFARLFKEYGIMTPAEFFAKKLSLLEGAALIRQYENNGERLNGCVKSKDDVSAVLLRL